MCGPSFLSDVRFGDRLGYLHMIVTGKIYRCPVCAVEKPLRGLACHVAKKHGMSSRDLHLAVLHDGSVPLCACGCGVEVKWLQRRFATYAARGCNGFSAAARSKAAEARRAASAAGTLTSWNAGLTKAPDERVLGKASQIPTVNHSDDPKKSLGQLELHTFVLSLASDARLSDRTVIPPKELDVYVPSKAFAVEYDGLYWHSLLHKGYANAKRDLCRSAGVSCVRVFEDEWRDKRDIVKAMIRHRLGISDERVGAREAKLVELDRKGRAAFLRANHLEGDVAATFALGLEKGGRLLAAASFRRPRHRSHAGSLELARFATLAGVSVPGALGRLVARASTRARAEGVTSLLTYVDTRVGEGRSYEQAGFAFSHETGPRFWWTDYRSRADRFSVRADKANGVTQASAASTAGVVQVFACSNRVLRLAL